MLPTLLLFVVCSLSQVHKTFSIQCNQCSSSVSWDDCKKKQTAVNCSSVFNTCITYHRILKDQNEFFKGCIRDTSCNKFECKKSLVTNSWCSKKCCNTTLCNDGVTQSPNYVHTLAPKREDENGSNSVRDSLRKRKDKNQKVNKPLECYTCSSYKSWEDCLKTQKLVKCPQSFVDACVTYHLVITSPSGEHQEHEYQKGCWAMSSCSNEKCRRTDRPNKGTWCDMRCCNSTKCNPSGFQQPKSSVALQVDMSNSANKQCLSVLATIGALLAVASSYVS